MRACTRDEAIETTAVMIKRRLKVAGKHLPAEEIKKKAEYLVDDYYAENGTYGIEVLEEEIV